MGNLSVGEFRKVAEGQYLEGLSVDRKRNVIWYSDVIAGASTVLRLKGNR